MTCLIYGFKTKTDLNALDQDALLRVRMQDPSIFDPFGGTIDEYMRHKYKDRFAVCLDHPKRMKFAEIVRTKKGVKVL